MSAARNVEAVARDAVEVVEVPVGPAGPYGPTGPAGQPLPVEEIGVEDGNLTIHLSSSTWGIDETGQPYYDADGVEPGDDALLTVSNQGGLVLVKFGA